MSEPVQRRVSVVIPAYNEECLLPACLRALACQLPPGAFEVIVVDNASSDGTASVARQHGARVVVAPVRGYGHALKCGFEAATGEIIAMTDADSVPPRDWVARLVEAYASDANIVAVGGDIQYQDSSWKAWPLTHVLIPFVNRIDRSGLAGPHMWGANFSVRRDAFLAVGGWNALFSLQADSEISERLARAGRVVVIDDLRVATSARRWNRSLVTNTLLFVGNFVYFHITGRPMTRDFPAVRETEGRAVPRTGRAARIAVTMALTLGLGWAGVAAFEPQSSFLGATRWFGPDATPVVALTFDDGPNPPCTEEILDILHHEHVHGTFFMVGSNVRLHPETAARVAREGHAIGNHSDTHPVGFALQNPKALEREIDSAERAIHQATGIYPHLFRPPHGVRSPWLAGVLEADSMVAVNWDDAPRDWDPVPAPELVRRTLAGAHPGAIILLHDGMNLTPHADQGQTVRALPEIIRQLRARGYGFATLPELLGERASLAQWREGGLREPSRPAAGPTADLWKRQDVSRR